MAVKYKKLRVLSCGAGAQSSSICLMIKHGEFEPIDAAIFADTQTERKNTYEHLKWLQTEAELPFPLYVVTYGNLAEDNLKVSQGKRRPWITNINNSIPMYVRNREGKLSQLTRHCTNLYKIGPIRKKITELVGNRVVKKWVEGDEPLVDLLMGISFDKSMRMKPSALPWIENSYPLIDKHLTRQECLKWMADHKYPTPPRSSCIQCFAGETEVITRFGIKTIKELAGTTPTLLVPKKDKYGYLSTTGKFREYPVREFGVQHLYELKLRRGRSEKIIFCTKEHNWIICQEQKTRNGFGFPTSTNERLPTYKLSPGDRLQTLNLSEKEYPTHWTVDSITPTNRFEPVYCATVDEIEAFALTDDLVTGNCPYHAENEWQRLKDKSPEEFQRAVEWERQMQEAAAKSDLGTTPYVHHSLVPLSEAVFKARKEFHHKNFFSEDNPFVNGCEEGYAEYKTLRELIL